MMTLMWGDVDDMMWWCWCMNEWKEKERENRKDKIKMNKGNTKKEKNKKIITKWNGRGKNEDMLYCKLRNGNEIRIKEYDR